MKKYFVYILLFLFCLTLTSCDISSGTDKKESTFEKKEITKFVIDEKKTKPKLKRLNNVTYPTQDYLYQSIDKTLKEAMNNFSDKVIKEAFDSGNNIFSPISLYFALAMLTEGVSSDECLNELLSLLDLDLETIENELKETYINDFFSNENGRLYLANSLWFRNEQNINQSYIDSLTDKYFAECYQADFSDQKVKQTIIDWINHYTEDLLELSLDNYEVPDDLEILLLNTIYFNNKWECDFKPEFTFDRVFYPTKDSSVVCKMMTHTITTKYYKDDVYSIVEDYFYNGQSIVYIMPNDYDLDNIINNGLSKFNDVEYSRGKVILSLPKFEVKKHYDLNEVLNNLGVTEIFMDHNNFQKIAQDLIVTYVKQDAGIKLSEQGVEAAAVTSIGMKPTSAGPSEEVYITLDKPFIYIIKDQNGLPLFIGTMTNPTI